MEFTVSIEGIEELEREWGAAVQELKDGMYSAVEQAGKLGALEARRNHPYRNRTRTLEINTTGGIVPAETSEWVYTGDVRAMTEYASYVDKGTSRSRPYPFMPLAEAKANQVLLFISDTTVARVIARMQR